MDMISDMQEHGSAAGSAYLGVTLRDLDAATSEAYQLPLGPYVNSVDANSAAEKAGVQKGDIILAVGDTEVQNFEQLSSAVKKLRAGDETTLTVYRGGEKLTLTVVMGERTEQTQPEEQQPEGSNSQGRDFSDIFRYFGFGN